MQSNIKINNVKLSSLKRIEWRKYVVYIAFVVVFAFFAITLHSEGFITVTNLLNITRQTAMISVMAVAMTFVIAAAQIDLSVGAITALTSLVTALILANNGNIFIAIVGGLIIGAIVGAINGFFITKVNIPAFLVTLGTMGITRGLAMWITNTAAVPISNQYYNWIFGLGDVLGFPTLFIWTIIFVVIGHFVLNYTPYGKYTLATGGNEEAAKYTGVNTKKIKFMVMLVSGIMASFAGLLYAGRMQAGRYSYGDGDELSVIAAVILGGTSMAGGNGSIIGSLFGSLMMGMINNGLIIAGLSVSQQMVVRGIIIILAVALGNKREE